ncbi:hypothetical protein [Nonomuraea sp. LPB2021202275-12-8]|uniref:hypothetical protein n=1 Tax=Nonomuraea sp. LPB2021202275-12-8 TaxID=3120159 RepID=UPI00300D313C
MRTPALRPVPAEPTSCRQPPRRTDDFRAVEKTSRWKPLAIEKDDTHAEPLQVAATPDGTIWTLHINRIRSVPSHLRRWDGSAWKTFDIPPVPVQGPLDRNSNPYDVEELAVTSARRVSVFGRPQYAHNSSGPGLFVHTLDKGRWRSEIFPIASSSHSVNAHGPWLRYGRQALRWNGSAWRSYRLPAQRLSVPAQGESALAGRGDEFWAVGFRGRDGFRMGMLRWKGTGWQEIGMPALDDPAKGALAGGRKVIDTLLTIKDVAVLGPADVWVVGAAAMLVATGEDEEMDFRPLALHWNGGSWRCHWGPVPTSGDQSRWFEQAEPDGSGGMWTATSVGELWHLSGGRWTRGRLPDSDGCTAHGARLVLRPGTREVYALGAYRCGREDRSALWRTR